MPPLPKVIFARPGRTQPCPISDACWSPSSAAIGGDPGRAVASPHTPTESTTRGERRHGNAEGIAHGLSFQPEPSISRSPFVVADAFVWSLTWSAPCDSVQATQESMVPMHRSRPSRSGVFASSHAALVADWFGASAQSVLDLGHDAVADGSQVLPAESRGRRVHRSHDPTSSRCARWLVMPTADDRFADGCDRRAGRVEQLRGHVRTIELDQPWCRIRRRAGAVLATCARSASRRRQRRAGRWSRRRSPRCWSRVGPHRSVLTVPSRLGSAARRYDTACLQEASEQTAEQAGEHHQGQREEDAEPVDTVGADQSDRDEDRLSAEIGHHRRDDAVAERCATALHPRRAPRPRARTRTSLRRRRTH